jgi:hypothetical protein
VETGFVAAIALLVLLGSAVVLLVRQGMIPSGLPAIKALGQAAGIRSGPSRLRAAFPESITESSPIVVHAAADAPSSAQQSMPATVSSLPDSPRFAVVPPSSETVAARLERIEEQLDALQRAIVRQGDELRAEVHQLAADAVARGALEDARRDGANERLRGDILAVLAASVMDQTAGDRTRQAEACADLYARLARLEASVAAVTNPILLPGEPYAPPGDFPPQALVWENWNEVGERAFALAEAYSAQRLLLGIETRDELGRFVTTLRTTLTRSIYPNLQPDAGAAQRAALRTALDQVAREIPRARDALERAYGSKDAT